MTSRLYRIKEMYNNNEGNGCSRNVYLVSGWMLITLTTAGGCVQFCIEVNGKHSQNFDKMLHSLNLQT